ncbi:MAG TPA: RNA polymerase sigma factor [Polyangiaceae bacterium]|nr:RNA polymerase sigma factor [Polyangiaceae bacterium]
MKSRVADPALRREVEAAVRRRVRGDDAEDVVQATLADVLQAPRVPEEPAEFRRFVFGVARNKVFDHFRRQRRYVSGQGEDDAAAPEPPLSARDILRWAEGELPDSESHSTLEWMLREGDGEKLENIARDAQVPAPRVRKRVSRLRKLLRERWAAELALIGFLLVCAGIGALYWYRRGKTPEDFVEREPPRPVPQAPRELPSSRPAGSAAPLPNLVAPPSSASPAPSAVPSGAPSVNETVRSPKAPRPARPTSTNDSNRTPVVPVPQSTGEGKSMSPLDLDSNGPPASKPEPSPWGSGETKDVGTGRRPSKK